MRSWLICFPQSWEPWASRREYTGTNHTGFLHRLAFLPTWSCTILYLTKSNMAECFSDTMTHCLDLSGVLSNNISDFISHEVSHHSTLAYWSNLSQNQSAGGVSNTKQGWNGVISVVWDWESNPRLYKIMPVADTIELFCFCFSQFCIVRTLLWFIEVLPFPWIEPPVGEYLSSNTLV